MRRKSEDLFKILQKNLKKMGVKGIDCSKFIMPLPEEILEEIRNFLKENFNPTNKKIIMKEVKVSIPDNMELEYDEESQSYRLVPIEDIEKRLVEDTVEADLMILYEKYKPLLKGKFSLHVNFSFNAYCDGNRKKVTHWVTKNSKISVEPGEKCWHD